MTDPERDRRDMMHRTADGPRHTPVATSGLVRRARVRRAGTAILAGGAVLTLVVGGFAATRSLLNDQAIPPASPRPRAANPRSEGIFADVQGWIAYGNKSGIWAVDPASPDGSDDRVLLTSRGGEPVAWASDGSKLLLLRSDGPEVAPDPSPPDLVVLNSDGTETRVPTDGTSVSEFAMTPEGSFTPDGSHVVYAGSRDGRGPSSIYVADVEGGTPQLLLAPSRRHVGPDEDLSHTSLYLPTLSPDGSQIAYFDGMGDSGHSLRVINSDGTAMRVVVDDNMMPGGAVHVRGLEWSPGGQHIAFAIGDRVYIVGTDGSGLRLVAKEAVDPYWSPDGSRISYTNFYATTWRSWGLDIATLEPGHVQKFGYGRSGPWNPLDR